MLRSETSVVVAVEWCIRKGVVVVHQEGSCGGASGRELGCLIRSRVEYEYEHRRDALHEREELCYRSWPCQTLLISTNSLHHSSAGLQLYSIEFLRGV